MGFSGGGKAEVALRHSLGVSRLSRESHLSHNCIPEDPPPPLLGFGGTQSLCPHGISCFPQAFWGQFLAFSCVLSGFMAACLGQACGSCDPAVAGRSSSVRS